VFEVATDMLFMAGKNKCNGFTNKVYSGITWLSSENTVTI
jgi:hypothetical protein